MKMISRTLRWISPSMVVMVLLTLSATAWAQSAGAVPPASGIVLTPSLIVTTMLGVVVGFLTRAVNTGSLFGIATVPKPWLPWLALVATFMIAFAGTLGTSTAINGGSLYLSVLSGLTAIIGIPGGSAMHGVMFDHLSSRGLAATAASEAPKGPGGDANAISSAVKKPLPVVVVVVPDKDKTSHPPTTTTRTGRSSLAMGVSIAALLGLLIAAPAREPAPTPHFTAQGCAWWNSGGNTQVAHSSAEVASCVLANIFGTGKVDFPSLTTACWGVTASDVVAITTSVVAYYAAKQTTGEALAGAGMMCGSGSAPYEGLPTCIETSRFALLATANANAKASGK